MAYIKVEVKTHGTGIRVVELNILNPQTRCLDLAGHIKRHFLGLNEVLEGIKVICTNSHLPLLKPGELFHVDHSGAKEQVEPPTVPQSGYSTMKTGFYTQAIAQTPVTHNSISNQPPSTPFKANSMNQQMKQDHTSFPTPSKMAPSRLRRSTSDGDLQATAKAREFAKLDRAAIDAQLLKPFTSRIVNARIMKQPSPAKEEKFRSQINKLGLSKALQLKQKRDDQNRHDKKGKNNRLRGSEKSTGARIAAITSMIEGNLHINENSKLYSSIPLSGSPSMADDEYSSTDPDEMGDVDIDQALEGITYHDCAGPYDKLGPFASRDSIEV